jgi:periplasmic protein TonB
MSAAMHGQESRVIHYAMLASIVLHALLLSFSTKDVSRRADAAPEPIVARLVEQQPAAPAQTEPIAPPRVEQPKPPAVKPQAPAKPRPVAKPAPKAPAAQPAPPAPPVPAPAAPTVQPEPQAPASAAPAPVPVAPAPSPAPSAGELDAGALARYRFEVAGRAAKLKVYPRAAIDNNWAGRVVVAVTVRANGVSSSSVRVSSGYKILDQQALDMITKAQARTQVPDALRGREFSFEIPVDFDLKESSG